ncbi:16S rRNA (adenine(1518)-N(6)/adenine(1519)-N(6))-dimethyltransferase RsmA [Thermoproteota archaeon]
MSSSIFYPKKRLGQSFLIEKNITQKIIKAASLDSDSIVLEIGPGKGILTQELCFNAKEVIAVEIDSKLYETLKMGLSDIGNLRLLNQDILALDLKKLLRKIGIRRKISIVANIPYRITTPILEYVFKNIELLTGVYLMVQREFALRLVARPDTKEYSSITCFTQFHCEPKLLFPVKRTCFRPQPRVDSYFIKLSVRERSQYLKLIKPGNSELLFKVVNTAFSQRRKRILNSLSRFIEKDKLFTILSKLEIDSNLRAENLSLKDYMRITSEFSRITDL